MFNPISIVFNGIVIALSLAFVLIMVWYDLRRHTYQYFVALLIAMIVWNTGNLATQFAIQLDLENIFFAIARTINEIGFTSTTITLYALTMSILVVPTRRFRWLIILTLILLVAWHIFFLIVNISNPTQTQTISSVLVVIFSGIIIFTLRRLRRKLPNNWIPLSILIIIIGQSANFLNPAISNNALSTTIGGVGVLILSITLIHYELIIPLKNRANQLEYMHKISTNLTKGINTKEILTEVTKQVTEWLNADAAIIFIYQNEIIYSAATHNLPELFSNIKNPANQGIAGKTIATAQSIRLDNYERDWKEASDFPIGRELIGAIISVPLRVEENIYGALLVISGKNSRSFSKEDEFLVEMLGAQAALSISQAELFNEQQELTTQVEQTLNQLTTVLESTENPVLAVDRELKLIFANRATYKLLHSTNSENVLGKPIQTTLIDKTILPKSYYNIYRNLRKQENFFYEFSLENHDYLCHITSLGIQRTEGWVIIVNDITEIKELDRIKSEMIRMTSHDLKNPLQAALANLDLLRDDIESLDKKFITNKDELCLSTSNIERELIKMGRIISGILDLERVRLAKANFEDKNPIVIIEESIEEIETFAKDKKITIKYHAESNLPDIYCDAQQIQRAIVNLIENAIKFSPINSVIKINMRNTSLIKYESNKEKMIPVLQLSIQDEGIGIPDEIQPHIFERFYRGRQTGSEHISGTGLGLSLVKAVVNAHNGTISLDSKPQQGTTFTISLPLK